KPFSAAVGLRSTAAPETTTMKRTTTTTAAIGIITLAAVVIFAWTAVHALFYAPDETFAPSGAAVVAPTSSDPARLIIPSLSIDANVQYVGVKKDGSMGTPDNFTDVAWYRYGTIPGQLGSAVIDGHVDNGLALAGVFKHLQDIKVGDDVYVGTKDG